MHALLVGVVLPLNENVYINAPKSEGFIIVPHYCELDSISK